MAWSQSRRRVRERCSSQTDLGTRALRRLHAWIPGLGCVRADGAV